MEEKTVYECQNCNWKGFREDMDVLRDADQRVDVGELMAAGECPECLILFDVFSLQNETEDVGPINHIQ